MRHVLALMAVGVLAVGLGNAAAAPEAPQIAIAKVRIDEGGTATVRVAIRGLSFSRGHWDFAYKLLGKKPGYNGKTHVRKGLVGSTFTNFLSGERWRLTVLLVDHGHKRVFDTDSRVVRAP